MQVKISSAKWRPFSLGFYALRENHPNILKSVLCFGCEWPSRCKRHVTSNTLDKNCTKQTFSNAFRVSKNRKIFTGLTYKLLLRLTVISDVYRPFVPNQTTLTKYRLTQLIWNPPSKAAPGIYCRSSGHSKHNCLQDRVNFHRSRAWQIVLSFNTAFNMFEHTLHMRTQFEQIKYQKIWNIYEYSKCVAQK